MKVLKLVVGVGFVIFSMVFAITVFAQEALPQPTGTVLEKELTYIEEEGDFVDGISLKGLSGLNRFGMTLRGPGSRTNANGLSAGLSAGKLNSAFTGIGSGYVDPWADYLNLVSITHRDVFYRYVPGGEFPAAIYTRGEEGVDDRVDTLNMNMLICTIEITKTLDPETNQMVYLTTLRYHGDDIYDDDTSKST